MEGPGRLDEFWGGWIWWRLGYDIVAVVYYFWCYTEAWFLISLGDVFLIVFVLGLDYFKATSLTNFYFQVGDHHRSSSLFPFTIQEAQLHLLPLLPSIL